MKPLDRLIQVEKLAFGSWEIIKKLEADNMNLKERVTALEDQLRPKGIDHGMIYDALREIDLCTGPPAPDETEEAWEAKFIERYGTREQFINERTTPK